MQELKVVVLDMQPITPAVGGGRQRLLGLYHHLGDKIKAVYVGTYDWPGESARDHQVTPHLREICIPLSDAHHRAAKETGERMAGRGMIDIEFPEQVSLSPEYLTVARREMDDADVVIFSHPWCYPPLANDLKAHQLVVYDAHNVESVLRVSLHDDLPQAAPLLEGVVATEAALLARSDLVYCCSGEEVALFQEIFEVPPGKLRIAPNGTFTQRFKNDLIRQRAEARAALPAQETIRKRVVFMGSQYGPNAEAGRFIVDELAPRVPSATFVLIGGVGESLMSAATPKNVVCTGIVDDEQKWALLLSADVAVNPMFSGAGTNVKMFDFLAAGLPVLTTTVGARGIAGETTGKGEIVVESRDSLVAALVDLLVEDIPDDKRLACLALVERRFSWEVISKGLGDQLRYYVAHRAEGRPSVLMLSTWGVACGIAEHAQYFAEGLRDAGANVVIFGNLLLGHEPSGVLPELRFPVMRGWHWDNRTWSTSRVDLGAFNAALSAVKPVIVVLQHHTGFMSVGDYAQIAQEAQKRGVPVVIECHDSAHLQSGEVALLGEAGAQLIVHSEREAQRLGNLDNILVLLHPVRSGNHAGKCVEAANEGDAPFVVGGFGFFREYKGIDITLEAVKLLHRKYPNLQYRGWHAVYPGEEQSVYVHQCLDFVKKQQLEQSVFIDTSFADIDEIIDGLSECDVVVLPYAPSNEGASGAANIALAAGVPLVVSDSRIFSSLSHLAKVVQPRTAHAFAEVIAELLDDDAKRQGLADKARNWAESNSYIAMARKVLAHSSVA
ncbi:MAG: glycosyltransferase [Rhodanobacter sp.]|nr:glycosyltransferase [Rhodanobacter sp.]ODU75071.1 MAG: hypothetical protein ABT17_05145 [Rhodanobacter sp. SCN 69-32]